VVINDSGSTYCKSLMNFPNSNIIHGKSRPIQQLWRDICWAKYWIEIKYIEIHNSSGSELWTLILDVFLGINMPDERYCQFIFSRLLPEKKLVLWILGHVQKVTQVCLGLPAHLFGLLLRRDEASRGSVSLEWQFNELFTTQFIKLEMICYITAWKMWFYQETSICSCNSSVGLDEGRLQFTHLCHGRDADTIITSNHLIGTRHYFKSCVN